MQQTGQSALPMGREEREELGARPGNVNQEEGETACWNDKGLGQRSQLCHARGLAADRVGTDSS